VLAATMGVPQASASSAASPKVSTGLGPERRPQTRAARRQRDDQPGDRPAPRAARGPGAATTRRAGRIRPPRDGRGCQRDAAPAVPRWRGRGVSRATAGCTGPAGARHRSADVWGVGTVPGQHRAARGWWGPRSGRTPARRSEWWSRRGRSTPPWSRCAGRPPTWRHGLPAA
jgi:hypothetical protein